MTSSSLAAAGPQFERRRVERKPVVLTGHTERLAEAARTCAEQARVVDAATCPHQIEAGERLERADEHRVRDSLRLADEVEAPVHAVGAVDVRATRRAEHRRVAIGAAAVAVRGRIFVVIRLDLDDPPADAVDVQLGTDQLRRHVVDAPVEERALQSAMRSKSTWSRHSPAIKSMRRASPKRSKPLFSSTRCEAKLSGSVPASIR